MVFFALFGSKGFRSIPKGLVCYLLLRFSHTGLVQVNSGERDCYKRLAQCRILT